MASSQQDVRNVSLILSEALSDIGVNEEMVMRRRNGYLFKESVANILFTESNDSIYYYGSLSEGTTTLGMNSDCDQLVCLGSYNVIQQLDNWKPNVPNILILQDESTAPGYCYLQRLCDDAPLAVSYVPGSDHVKDSKGRILLKNTIFHGMYDHLGNIVHHGPAATLPRDGFMCETDRVLTFYCKRWPSEARHWLHRRSSSGWPTMQLKTECERSGCFLVPVCSKSNGNNELEWRISTSHAERYLMFSLNITHFRCYVLLKFLLKTHINRGCGDTISSYMCKTAMFHCVERYNFAFWREDNLLICLNQILREIYNYVLKDHCPHFIIPENNLMAGRVPQEQKHLLLENIQHIINNVVVALFEIDTDCFGRILYLKLNVIRELPERDLAACRLEISFNILFHIAYEKNDIHISKMIEISEDNFHLGLQRLLCYFEGCKQDYVHSSQTQKEACLFYLPLMCSTIGSVLASVGIMQNRPISGLSLKWFELGLNSDVSSCWLKLATANYSSGKMKNTEAILRHVEHKYDVNLVQQVCSCYDEMTPTMSPELFAIVDRIQNCDIGKYVSYCVIFTRLEQSIVPHEMQQEYSRSTHEEKRDRSFNDNWWMNFAVIDSLPYLYFLQYKTFGRLGNHGEQETALCKLKHVIRNRHNLKHKDTALNLLGQCMEQENQPDEAFNCYERSLQVRPRHNAAQFHRARLLS